MWRANHALVLSAFLALWLGKVSSAPADLLMPNGNPTGDASQNSKEVDGGVVTLGPQQAGYLSGYAKLVDISWLGAALDKQGFNAANKWNFTTTALNGGNIQLGTYTAFADNAPAVTIGAGGDKLSSAAEKVAGYGGAAIALNYQPKPNPPRGPADPSGNSVHWLQVIRTNVPSAFGKANGFANPADPGFTYYIDNGYRADGKVPGDPFYDSGYLANHVNFIDLPYRAFDPGATWNAEVFLVNDVVNAGVHNDTIYDGVYWGFQTTTNPEPGSLLLCACGAAGMVAYGWKRWRDGHGKEKARQASV